MDRDKPALLVPVVTGSCKFGRLRGRNSTALDDPKVLNALIIKRKHYVAWFGETHVLVELVIAVVPIALGRPKIAAANLMLRPS